MEISWFESFLYGLTAGLAEMLPISSLAHQNIIQSLFGFEDNTGILRLSVTAGSLLAFVFSVLPLYKRIRRECQIHRVRRRKKSKTVNMQYVFDMNFIKTACIPILLGLILYRNVSNWRTMVPVISLFLAVNGLILHLPVYFAKGNKDSRSMSSLDGFLVGAASALGYLPGVSRIAVGFSSATMRGADSFQALKWSLLLSVPALFGMLCIDGYTIASAGLAGLGAGYLAKCFTAAVSSWIGTGIGIGMMKKLLLRTGPEGFAYYCWGAALFSFILYMY